MCRCPWILALWLSLGGQVCLGEAKGVVNWSFSLRHAQQWLTRFTESPHTFGSLSQKRLAQWMVLQLRREGWTSFVQDFEARVPSQDCLQRVLKKKTCDISQTSMMKGKNVVAANVHPHHKCIIIIGSHYDTKHLVGQKYVGANDSASSSLLLPQLLSSVARHGPSCGIVAVWFDGEEAVLPGWNDSFSFGLSFEDHTYGSRYFVSQLERCGNSWCLLDYPELPIRGLLLLDMIGSPEVKFSLDGNSNVRLRSHFYSVLKQMGLEDRINADMTKIEDDHIPFIEKGIPALNIIDFENLRHWHRPSDLTQHLSLRSVAMVGKVADRLIHFLHRNPM
ncbi:MAG: M28 family peptidase [Zetaproteobacteria bacterium]|nr:M28 family peptidase [Zetaproteobacteria bacterium]